nr:immunoglobulin light chain junction region [Macaca mulatta]
DYYCCSYAGINTWVF